MQLGDLNTNNFHDKKEKNNLDGYLFQSEVSIVEESESRR